MSNSYYSLNQRKAIKHIKLGCFSVWKLKRCGKKDFKNKLIHQRAEGQIYSPFFKQEISLCMAAIQNEKETLAKILMDIDAEIIASEFRIDRGEKKINRLFGALSANSPNDTITINSSTLVSNQTDIDIINTYRQQELVMQLSAKTKRMDDLSKSIEKIKIRKEQKLRYAENEIEITEIRCYQLYELLKARISTYWMGALKASSSIIDTSISPFLDIDSLTREIETELNNFVKVKKNGQELLKKNKTPHHI